MNTLVWHPPSPLVCLSSLFLNLGRVFLSCPDFLPPSLSLGLRSFIDGRQTYTCIYHPHTYVHTLLPNALPLIQPAAQGEHDGASDEILFLSSSLLLPFFHLLCRPQKLHALCWPHILACECRVYSSPGRPITRLQLDNAGLAAAAMHRERVTKHTKNCLLFLLFFLLCVFFCGGRVSPASWHAYLSLTCNR